MGFHLLVILGLAAGCVVFGLLRAELLDGEAEENPICESCDEGECSEDGSSCGHFCFHRPATDVPKLLQLK
ncbi:MAG: hypothetical protein WAO20_10805 [Acidobacteriota bacterium]